MSNVFYVDIDGVRQEAKDKVLDQILEDKKLTEAKQAELLLKAEAKATAQAKLAALGLTISDLEALGL